MYSIDRINSAFFGDVRLEELYKALQEGKVSYGEIFHTIPGRDTIKNFFRRKRPILYLEGLNSLFSLWSRLTFFRKEDFPFIKSLDLRGFSEAERLFMKNIIMRYSHATRLSLFKIRTLMFLLSLTRIRVLFSIDDARFYNELLVATHMNDIRSYALQHGHFTEHHIGTLKDPLFEGKIVAPDHLLVWGSYWKRELEKLGSIFPQESIIVGGAAKLPLARPPSRTHSESVGILIPYENSAPKREVVAYIHKMLACGARVIFKLRLGFTEEEQLADYGLTRGFHPRFETTFDAEEVIDRVDIIAGVYSSFLYDMIAYEKRVVILDTSSAYGRRIVLNGLADLLTESKDICAELHTIREIPQSAIATRRATLYDSTPLFLRDTLRTIMSRHKVLKRYA